MWFHNLQLYRLSTPWTITADQLREQLARGPFVPTAGLEARSRGWVAPRKDGDLVYAANGHWLICLKTETRLLPPATDPVELNLRKFDRCCKKQHLEAFNRAEDDGVASSPGQ